ncbi:MAG: hypothetical protein JWP75_513 [Frondihabitans sp.]|nr:hypothetical protein [Frondihabitans sp.]
MNHERPNELVAKRIVEHVMRVQLEHHDTHGGVDYLSSDGTVALEVTAVTDGEKDGAWKALKMSEAKGASNAELQACWIVFVSDKQTGMKTFVQRVQPAIVELEAAGETFFDNQRAAMHVIEKGKLSQIYRQLLDAGVERATYAPHEAHAEDPSHIHRLLTSSGGGGSASGSDESLVLLVDALREKPDNPLKLRQSGAGLRHLFVWLNDNTGFTIARPLSREAPPWGGDEWGLPTIAPALDPAITHLWVMHARSRLGWLWDGESWQGLRESFEV